MESFGLGYDALAALNPGLVYCSISAFGRTGPRRDGAGYEALMQAFSGIMSITGEPGGPPSARASRSSISRPASSLRLRHLQRAAPSREDRPRPAGGRLAAGDRRDPAQLSRRGVSADRRVPKALGSSHPSLSPYRNFRCRDGQWVFIAGANDRFWQRLVAALDLAALRDDDALREEPRTRAVTASIWRRRWRTRSPARPRAAAEAPRGSRRAGDPVNTVDQVMNDPQTAARGMIERVRTPKLGEIPVIGTPVKFSRMRPGVRTPAPLQGEHTDEVLAEYGYSAERDQGAPGEEVIW